MKHIADNQDALLDFLYDEGDPAARLTIRKHLQECAACSVAVLELQTVRGMLGEWSPPASQLGFRIVQGQDPRPVGNAPVPAHVAPWPGWMGRLRAPRWAAQAAAAVLLFAAGMAVSQLHVDYTDGAVTVHSRSAEPATSAPRSGWIQLPASTAAIDAADPATRLTTAAAEPRSASTEELLQRVRAMIEQSEARQQRELALRLTQVSREVDTQHKADVQHIQQNLGRFEMETGAQIDQQRQQMEYLVRTSGGGK